MISLIIPTYRNPEYLDICLKSAIENQVNKKDWALSNRYVGFNVDIGIRNQNIFNHCLHS